MTAITLHEGGRDTKIPLYPTNNTFQRTPGDVAIEAVVSYNVPIHVVFVITPDGTLTHWRTNWVSPDYTRSAGFVFYGPPPKTPATPKQTEVIAMMWLAKTHDEVFGVHPGHDVCEWAFAGMTPDQVAAKYGDGKPVFLNG